jgi:hypothetical protein
MKRKLFFFTILPLFFLSCSCNLGNGKKDVGIDSILHSKDRTIYLSKIPDEFVLHDSDIYGAEWINKDRDTLFAQGIPFYETKAIAYGKYETDHFWSGRGFLQPDPDGPDYPGTLITEDLIVTYYIKEKKIEATMHTSSNPKNKFAACVDFTSNPKKVDSILISWKMKPIFSK